MIFSVDQTLAWIIHYKYFILLPLTVIEGPIITVIAGFFASLGYLNFFILYPVIVAGDLLGDIAHYYAGYWGGKKFIGRFGGYFGVGLTQIESIKNQFQKRGSRLLFIGKMTHGVGGAFLIAAGLIKMPFSQYFFSNLLATLIKSFLLLLLGFYFGNSLSAINSYFGKIALATTGLAALALIIYFFYFRKKRIIERE